MRKRRRKAELFEHIRPEYEHGVGLRERPGNWEYTIAWCGNPRAHPCERRHVASTARVSKPLLAFAEPYLGAECSWISVPWSALRGSSRHPGLRVRSRACTLPEASR